MRPFRAADPLWTNGWCTSVALAREVSGVSPSAMREATNVRVQIRPELVAVPLPLFGLVWSTAEEAYRTAPGPYVAGVVNACRWVADWQDTPTPLYGLADEATPERIRDEDMRASVISMQPAGSDPRVGPTYAAGVANALGWIRGTLDRVPVNLPARTA
jgi:hypothetical protein